MHVPLASDQAKRERRHPTYLGRDRFNYTVVVNPETCKACGFCIKRCPMKRSEKTHEPPKDVKDCMQSCMADHFHFLLVPRWPEDGWSQWQGGV